MADNKISIIKNNKIIIIMAQFITYTLFDLRCGTVVMCIRNYVVLDLCVLINNKNGKREKIQTNISWS